MATSFGALCTDFYVNQKLALKMDLPSDRETVLHLFDRIRKSVPTMTRFHRYEGEFSLESSRQEAEYHWLAMRRKSVRGGHVNPSSMDEAYRLHELVLEVAPYHLSISPLDVDYLELMFGFDLECSANHDEVVTDALLGESPLADVLAHGHTKVLDFQPLMAISLTEAGDLQGCFEVKTRRKNRRGSTARYADDPISILLTLRQFDPIDDIRELPEVMRRMGQTAESLATERLLPHILTPIARQITSSSA